MDLRCLMFRIPQGDVFTAIEFAFCWTKLSSFEVKGNDVCDLFCGLGLSNIGLHGRV